VCCQISEEGQAIEAKGCDAMSRHNLLKRRQGRAARTAFTLVEIMIVLAILLLLSGLVGVAVLQRRGDAQVSAVKIDLNNLRSAMQLFYLDFDRYPTEEEGLAVLWDRSRLDQEEDERGWRRYLDRPLPTDRWGQPWGYRPESEHEDGEYDLWSYGPDRQDGTEDDINAFPERQMDDEFEREPGRGG
jgi:general secretion pathway protein G